MTRLMTVANGPEAELIVGRLQEAGIRAVAEGGTMAAYAQEAAPHDIYVEEADLERARDLLDLSQSDGGDDVEP
jgi:hypothetical protein